MNLTARVDTSNLMRAQMVLLRHSNTSPARAINKTAYYVINDVIEADGGFPVVSQSTIDSNMQVTSTPKLSTRGPRKGLPLKDGSSDLEVPDMSAAMKIVIARMNPQSKYSLSTGNRWPVATQGGWHAMIRGFAKAYGSQNAYAMALDAIRPIAERMVRARHSSTGFLKKSWIDLRMALFPYSKGQNNPFGGGGMITNYADISPAKEGYPLAVCRVSNMLGTSYETTKELSEKYNQANHDIAEPRLRASINREFQGKMEYADKQEWAKDEPELRALGLLVKP
jgi:hypothetical protein